MTRLYIKKHFKVIRAFTPSVEIHPVKIVRFLDSNILK